MVSNKLKIDRKALLKISLIFFGLLIIFLTYFTNLEKKQQEDPKVSEDTSDDKRFLEEGVNRFENVEYRGSIESSGDKFVIGSKFAEFEKENPELINMENVKCLFTFKDNTVLTIISDKAVFNNLTNDMKFSENVRMDYLENILYSDRADFNNYENQLLVAGNISGEGPTADLNADELDFDLTTKNLKISMYSEEERVKIKTKY